MPEYIYKNPETGEQITVWQSIHEEHSYEIEGLPNYRVYTIPHSSIDTRIDPNSEKEFRDLAKRCCDANFQLCTHAIGDRGNRMVLDIYSEIMKNRKNHRWRIEHAQMVCDEDIPRFSKAGIIPSMQPSHCTSDMPWLHNRLGTHRLH